MSTATLTFLHTPIGGTQANITTYVDLASVRGQNDLTARIDTLTFNVIDLPVNTIREKSDIKVRDQFGTLWFGGQVGHIYRRSDTRTTVWEIDVQGYGALLDSRTVNAIYNSTTDTAVLSMLLAAFRPDLTLSIETPAQAIDSISFPYRSLSSALTALCNLMGTKFYVDPNKVLHYFNPNHLTNPSFGLSDTPDAVYSWAIEHWDAQSDSTQLANRVTVIGQSHKESPITDTFTGDGSTQSFTLKQRPSTVYTFTVNGSTIGYANSTDNVAYNSTDPRGHTVICLVKGASQLLTFSPAPAAGATIALNYDYYTPLVVRVPNVASYTLFGDWYDAAPLNDSAITTSADAISRASTVLAQYAYPAWQVRLTTRAPFMRAGLVVWVQNQTDLLNGNAINNFIIQSNTWSPKGGQVIWQDLILIG